MLRARQAGSQRCTTAMRTPRLPSLQRRAGDSSGRSAFNVVHIIAPCLRGDVNRSGVINASDAPALVSALLAVSVDPDTFCVADVNGDGQLNGLDIEAFENVLP